MPHDDDLISNPNDPTAAEIAFRTKVIVHRLQQLSAVLAVANAPPDDVTGSALIALGATMLCSPASTIDPAKRDLFVAEMVALGQTMVESVRIAEALAKKAREN